MRNLKHALIWAILVVGLLWSQVAYAATPHGRLAASSRVVDDPPSLFLPMLSNASSAAPAQPNIHSFTAEPNTIEPGGTSTLSWNVGGATTLSISPGIGAVTGTSIAVNPATTTEYILTAANAAGSVTAKTTVTVAGGNAQDGATWLPFTTAPDGVVHTRGTNVAVDGSGGIHAGYAIWVGLDNGQRPAYYAYCTSGCNLEESWTRTSLVLAGETVADVRLALDSAGRPRMLIFSTPIGDSAGINHYTYAVCNNQCTVPASWTLTPVTEALLLDQYRWDYVFRYFSLDPQGHPAFIYFDAQNAHSGTFYAACMASPVDKCSNSANWSEIQLHDHWLSVPSLAFTPDGKPRAAVYFLDGENLVFQLWYLACDANCMNSASWSGIALFDMHGTGRYSLRLDSQGRPRMAYYSGDYPSQDFQPNHLYYLWCDSNCANATQDDWQMHDIGLGSYHGSDVDLALDGANRPRIAYDAFGFGLGYAWCDANCETDTAVWQHQVMEESDTLEDDFPVAPIRHCTISTWVTGEEPILALDKDGNARVGYVATHNYGGNDLDHPGEVCNTSTDILLARFMQFAQP